MGRDVVCLMCGVGGFTCQSNPRTNHFESSCIGSKEVDVVWCVVPERVFCRSHAILYRSVVSLLGRSLACSVHMSR